MKSPFYRFSLLSKTLLCFFLATMCIFTLFFSTASFTEFCTAHHDLTNAGNFHHDIEETFSLKPDIHMHHHNSDEEHTHSHEHTLSFETLFLGSISTVTLFSILPILINCMGCFPFSLPRKLYLLSIFRPPKFSFSI